MTRYFIQLVDGVTYDVTSTTKASALRALESKLGYEDYDDIMDDVAVIEYKDESDRIVEYQNPKRIEVFPRNSKYLLEPYTNKIPILHEHDCEGEFEEIFDFG